MCAVELTNTDTLDYMIAVKLLSCVYICEVELTRTGILGRMYRLNIQ
jgi:hypothetical protein